jgi:ABC-type bacteriocin/lantibiotic exporter with double-glycine peptidase domain
MDVIYDLLTGLDKLAVVTDLPLQKQEGLALPAAPAEAPRKGMSVSLRDVNYDAEYDWNTPLKGINLEIKSGERVCIAGNKDSGKSDLLRIIASLYTHYHGSVAFDGWPSQNLHLGSLRKVIGNLSKAEDIFRGTVYENITLGYPEITPGQVKEVMDQVGLHDTLHKMPDGLDTMLMPGGFHMSKGMRTKILLARCLVTNPRLIVCDELLQTLSDDDRLAIIQLLTNRNNPWTLVTVSDDPQLAAACDRILVMQDGSIVFEGNFDAIRNSPYYHQVFHIIDQKE